MTSAISNLYAMVKAAATAGKDQNTWIISSRIDLVEQYARWAGIPEHKRFPHALKHTCGIQMRRSGASLETIQNALGHKRLDWTAMYLRVTQDEVDDARAKAFTTAVGA